MFSWLGTAFQAFHWYGIASFATKTAKTLGSFGAGVMTYHFVAPQITAWFATKIGSTGFDIAAYFAILKVDVCISIIVGAIAYKLGEKMAIGPISAGAGV